MKKKPDVRPILFSILVWWCYPIFSPDIASVVSWDCLFRPSDGQYSTRAIMLFNFHPVGWIQGHVVFFPGKCQNSRTDCWTVECHRWPSFPRVMHSHGNIGKVCNIKRKKEICEVESLKQMFDWWWHNFIFLLVPPQLSFSAFRNFIVHKLKERCVICKNVHRNGIGSSKNDPFVDVRNRLFAINPAIAKQSAIFDKTSEKNVKCTVISPSP